MYVFKDGIRTEKTKKKYDQINKKNEMIEMLRYFSDVIEEYGDRKKKGLLLSFVLFP